MADNTDDVLENWEDEDAEVRVSHWDKNTFQSLSLCGLLLASCC